MWTFCEGNHGQPIEAKRVNLRSIEANRGQTTRKKIIQKLDIFLVIFIQVYTFEFLLIVNLCIQDCGFGIGKWTSKLIAGVVSIVFHILET